ncbi:pectate lyase superfamily protein-domain-containing protein [Xylaria acuta]|nr:pectate lyase superfamily protein-domain-containing protein [Xylaria acuta]
MRLLTLPSALLLLSSLCLPITGLSGPVEGISSLENVDFLKPSPAALDKIREAHRAAVQVAQSKRSLERPRPVRNPVIRRHVVGRDELAAARKLVDQAALEQSAFNEWTINNPRKNNYHHKTPGEQPVRRRGAPPRPIFNQATLDAVKLVGDVDAQDMFDNGTFPDYANDSRMRSHGTFDGDDGAASKGNLTKRQNEGGWWLGRLDHTGSMPFGGNSSYRVWRNVQDYGAAGDGITDDTKAIQRAITDGGRCGANCAGSTVKGAVVYFPYGVYRISSTLISYFDTQLVGEIAPAGGMPVLQAATSFIGDSLITCDVYLADGTSEWYLNTANFYRNIRNFNIDLRLATRPKNLMGIHWQVAQAASIENVKIYLTSKSASTQVGIFAENGSGGWIADITVEGGLYGFLGGNQQYSVSNYGVRSAKNGIGLIWDWAWSWSHLSIQDCDVGVDLTAPGSLEGSPVGSIMLVDSYFSETTIAIKTYKFKSTTTQQGTTVLSLNNVGFSECLNFIVFPDNSALGISEGVSNSKIGYLQYGNLAANGDTNYGLFRADVVRAPELTEPWGNGILGQEAFVRRSRPIYFDRSDAQILNANLVAKGDGVTDDTAAIQALLDFAVDNAMVLYIPAGSYMISAPIMIPSGSRIVGESWSQLMAYGSAFTDESNPAPFITVGNGEAGEVELQNLIFTSKGALPGLVMVQWNIKASSQGSVGMWDCHFRVGGAKGTGLTQSDCPKLTGGVQSHCIAGSIMLLVTGNANGYFENVWAWVSDHDIDFPSQDMSSQVDIFFARGMLIQGDGGGMWFRGTGSEHSVMYQYNLVNAKNVYMSIIQTESPYFQGAAQFQAPTPFRSPLWIGDPVFDMCGEDTVDCNAAWSLIVQFSEFIYIDGAGMYSWFKDYVQDCVNDNSCQQRLVNIHRVGFSFLCGITTIGARETLTPAISESSNTIKYAEEHLQALVYPWWATIATYAENLGRIDVTTEGYPIKTGWVGFGDSYAAGIGAGKPLDTVKDCSRGTGGYIAILDQIVRFAHNVQPNWQPLACSGETAQQFIDGTEKGKQIENWFATDSDLATSSFTGNDLGFGDIVAHCIMGYKSRDNCQADISKAEAILEANTVQELVFDVLDKIHAKAVKERFIVYWTSYPRFFEVQDTECDTSYFHEYWYSGEYLTTTLRNQLNKLSADVNGQIDFAIRRYNAARPYPKVMHVNIDGLGNIYDGKRFCELGVNEPYRDEAGQNKVAFFYDNGWDDVPAESEGFHIPPQRPNAPSDWSIDTYNSNTCSVGDGGTMPLETFNCAVAKDIASGGIPVGSGDPEDVYTSDVTHGGDGSVSITETAVKYAKMFHPKTRANWHIAQAISDAFRRN